MRIVGPAVLAAFDGRIVNTHPSLLPAFPGAHAVEDALAAGVRVTGCTVHLVDATLDGGPIVAQEAVPILPGDDAATLHDRIRAVEHRLLPQVVARLLAGAFTVEADGRRVAQDLRRADTDGPDPSARAAVGLGQDGAGDARSRARRARLRARVDRWHGARPARRGTAGDRRGRRDRVAGDARRAGQDAPSAHPRRPAGRSPPRGPPAPAPRRRHRTVRGGGREPVPVRGCARPAGHHGRRADRGDRHRRSVHGPGGGQEPRQRGHRDVAGPVRRPAGRLSTPRAASTIGAGAPGPSTRSPTPPPTTPASPRRCPAG